LPQLIPGTNSIVEIFDATEPIVTPILSLEARSAPEQAEYELDCRNLPAGLYRFQSPNIAASTLYIGQENSSSDVLVVIDVFLAGLSSATFDIRFNHN